MDTRKKLIHLQSIKKKPGIMGSIALTIPDVTDADLLFDEQETRQVLKFFWPNDADRIDKLKMTNDARRLAQFLLIAAVEASYALGLVDATFRSLARPGSSIKALCRKLARRFSRHWFKHATRDDLMDVKIYVMVQRDLAREFKHRLEELLNGLLSSRRKGSTQFQVAAARATIIARI